MKIGDKFDSGIVFWVYEDGKHGLIAATEDQSEGCSWDEATQLCDDYRDGGFDDWRLPSKVELNLLFSQKSVIGGFTGGSYWSSTEFLSVYGLDAWSQSFFISYQVPFSKAYSLGVRAIRAF